MDLCGFCGENAVITEEVDGSQREICAECGSLVYNNQTNPDPELTTLEPVVLDERSKLKPPNCNSCGCELDQWRHSTSCPECSKLEQEDNPFSPGNSSLFSDEISDHQSQKTHLSDKKEDLLFYVPEVDNVVRPLLIDNDTSNDSHYKSSNHDIIPYKSEVCKSCNGTDLEVCEVGCETQIVCKGCGTMTQHVTYQSASYHESLVPRGTSDQTLPKQSFRVSQHKPFKDGKIKIEDLCSKLCLDTFMMKEAKEMFEKAYYSKDFIKCIANTKMHLSAACVFVVARNHDIPICLVHMMKYIDSLKLFLTCKTMLLKALGLTCKNNVSLTAQIRQCIEGKGFHPSIHSSIRDIIFLCRKAWLTQGRNREHLIIIAAFYAFSSSKYCEYLIGFEAFRKKFGFQKVTQNTFKHCNDFFLKMAKKLPWVNKNLVTIKTFKAYIDDVLKYQNSLLFFAFESNEDVPQPKTIEINGRGTFSKRKCSNKEPLLPPCMKKIKKEPYPYKPQKIPQNVDLDSPELKETEFQDEIDSYILTEEEQKTVADLKSSMW